jgi:hypothetical protein
MMDAPYGRLFVLKKSGAEGGVCQMTDDTLHIGRCEGQYLCGRSTMPRPAFHV